MSTYQGKSNRTKIYVGSLSHDTSREDLEKYFGRFGRIKTIKLILDHATGRSKNFAFIEFDSKSSVQDALKKNGDQFMGRKIRVRIAREKSAIVVKAKRSANDFNY